MHFDGQIFDGSPSLYYSDMHLQLLAGSAQWFPEFTPTDFVALNFMFAHKRNFLIMLFAVMWAVRFPNI